MCPICSGVVAWLAAGSLSAGGVVAFTMSRLRTMQQEKQPGTGQVDFCALKRKTTGGIND